MGKLQLIQAMRGVAALLVVMYHLTTNSAEKFGLSYLGGVFAFGYSGVDFFFVLSGFIIFYVHHRDLGRPDRVAPYLWKRFVRVYPIYWFVTLAVLPAYFLFRSFGHGHETDPAVIVKSLLLVHQGHNPIVTVAWTLVHEVLFYVLFAAAIFAGARAALAGAVLWGAACVALHDDYLFSTFNLEFLSGVAAAWLVTRGYRLRTFALGCALFAAMGLLEAFEVLKVHRVLAYGLPSVLIVLGAVTLEREGLKLPRLPLLLGDASYSVYLVHSIVIALLLKFVPASTWPVMSAVGVVAVGAGVLVHLLVERPVLRELRRGLFVARAEPPREARREEVEQGLHDVVVQAEDGLRVRRGVE